MRISLASFGLLTLLTLLPLGELLRLPQQGSVCDGDCPNGLECTCLALNRGLRIREPEGFLSPPAYAEAYERQGLTCEPRLPLGAMAMAPPPLVPGAAMDPREQPALKSWAQDVGRGFYSQYLLIHHPEDQLLGVPLLAGPDVSSDYFHRAARTLRHILLDALSSDTLSSLAHTGVRVLIAGPEDGEENDENDPWLKHPECSKHFTTGLGGGSPLFPSTGVYQDESQVTLVEELLHTIQYCALSPRSVCMYHKAYQHAMRHHLYTTDGSAEEVDGEPVPTVQADEYLAMAMHRWFGSVDGKNEYKVPGNTAAATGRQALQEQDPKAFCILSSIFRADDDWNPDETLEPWASHGNRKMDLSEVQSFCKPVLEKLAMGCPKSSVTWPNARPRMIP